MADRVYLHIGAQKTGTSYLQLTMRANRDALERHGVFLALKNLPSEFDAVSDLRGGMWADRKLRATWEDLVRAVHATEGTMVVSQELLCSCTPEQIDRVVSSLAPAELHIVHAARDLGRQVPAEWQQSVRARSDQGYTDYISALRADPDHVFWTFQDPVLVHSAWRGAVPPERYHLLTVPPSGRPSVELWERFAATVGAQDAEVSASETPRNESMGVGQTELLRRFNAKLGDRFPMRTRYTNVVHQHLIRPAFLGAPGQRIGVPAEHAEWVVARAEQMVTAVTELARVVDLVGAPEDLRADITEAVTPPEDLGDAELLDLALESWVRQMEHTEQTLASRARRQAQTRAQNQARSQARREREAADAARFGRRVRRRLRSVLTR